MGQFCALTSVFLLMLASLALTVVAMLTDNWYRVSTHDNVSAVVKRSYNFHYGLWRMCYDDMPSDISSDDSYKKEGSCVYIYEDLIQRNEGFLDQDSKLRLHLSRTVLGCSVAAAAATLFALLSATCGVWPSRSMSAGRKSCVYVATAILLLLATMSGITSGVSFIAIRDLDNTTLRRSMVVPPAVPEYADQTYDWSFMLHWIATGLSFLASFFMICLLRGQASVSRKSSESKMNGYDTPL